MPSVSVNGIVVTQWSLSGISDALKCSGSILAFGETTFLICSALIIPDLVLNSWYHFIGNTGTISNWKETFIYWFCHRGFLLKTSLFKAISDFSYVSRLTESSLLCKHWLPWSQAGCSLHLPIPCNKFFVVLGVPKSSYFLKAVLKIHIALLLLRVQNCFLS